MAAGLAITLANAVMVKLGKITAQEAFDEAPLLLSFLSDFKWLEKKLRQICASLQAADEQNTQSGPVRKWLVEVRNIVFDAEDIIDECTVDHLYPSTSQSCVPNCTQLVFRYKIGNRIKDVKDRISSAIEEAQKLNLSHDVTRLSQPSTSTSGNQREAEWRRWDVVEPPAVGIDYKVEEILSLLDNTAIGVVAVIGMGGLGKTFLLQHVFNRYKQRYEHYAWISVSRTCYSRKLQCDLASQIGLHLEHGITDRQLVQSIQGKLGGKSCLIVLDDVWSSSVEGNLISRLGLPTGPNNHCKIVVTTRNRDVVENMNAHVYEMQYLSAQDSLRLFCMYAFPDREDNKPPEELENLPRQVVEECGRLPLAIKIVAASMAKPWLIQDWESKLEQLKYVGRAEDTVMKILKLSYDNLPSHLKSCFAYFSFFPDDTQIYFSRIESTQGIHQDYLIYLWIVEGFIPGEQGKDQWDTGFDYLHQLIDLCFVDVNTVSICYTVHDLLHDLVVFISKENGCKFDLRFNETASYRRLLLGKKSLNTNVLSERPLFGQRVVRTLSLSQNYSIASIPLHMFDRVRLLRVLDLSSTTISALPESVGKLKLLRVFNMSNTEISVVPGCVSRLKILEFLDVSHCKSLQRVPDWIGELRYLSYLDIEWCSPELTRSGMPKGMSQLSKLTTLKSDCFPLSVEENEFINLRDVGNLTNLHEISFTLKNTRALTSLEGGALDRLVKMRILVVQNAIPHREGSSLPVFPKRMNVMRDLKELFLERFSVSWICELKNLTLLSLVSCSDYPWLQRMPNLQILLLENDSKSRELPENFGESGGFRNLLSLQIRDFPRLKKLPALIEGAMQRLEGLVIVNCPLVKEVPEGVEWLRGLKRILVRQVSDELKERLRDGGEDWVKVKARNPNVAIRFL